MNVVARKIHFNTPNTKAPARARQGLKAAFAAALFMVSSAAVQASNESANYSEHVHDGRIYVIGNAETREAFEATHHLPYTQTFIGYGPNGETTVFEVDKKNPELTAELIETFDSKHRFYAEEHKDGRIYVIGDTETHNAFKTTHHLPYTHTRIGYGPKGETVIIEVNKKIPALQRRLLAQFDTNHRYYAEEKHDGRYYVIGDNSTHDMFKKTHHLPYTKTLIGAGPKGESVVIEVNKKNPHLATRLEATFRQRRGL